MNLARKVIVVTGATGGIGKELVQELAQENAHLVLVATNLVKLHKLLKTLPHPENHLAFACDLADSSARKRLVSKIRRRYPMVDCLIHAAGIGIYKPLAKVTEHDWQSSFAINVDAPYFLTQMLLPLLLPSPLALTLSLGSGAGVIPMAGRSVYCSTKFALRGMTLSLAEEFKDKKPKFCLLTLGSTLTSFGPHSLAIKKAQEKAGKAYFTPDWVANQLVDIIKDDHRKLEYTLYPGDYGHS